MQGLWTRAAQTRASCRCIGCLHAASAIAGRSTAASKRRLKIGDLFTACYSTTILGTAVFADAKFKEERRKQWDRAIAEAKAGLRMDDQRRVERTVADLDQPQESPSLFRPVSSQMEMVLPKITGPDGASLTSSRSAQDDAVDIMLDSRLEEALATPTETSRISPSPASPELEADWPDESDPDIPHREPLKQIHIDKMEEMVSKLVARLLHRSEDDSTMGSHCTNETDGSLQLKDIMEQFESLQQGAGTRFPSYTFSDRRVAAMERRRMNNAIEGLFTATATDQSNIDLILAKICYNLLVSSTPPNIQTYNILIRSLTRLRLHGVAQDVVDSFFFDSKFRPSSETVQLLLNHYSVQKDLAGFRAIVDRMRVVNEDMRIKRQSLDSLRKPKVQAWAMTSKVTHKGGCLREKVHRDADIFDSLINGFLDLDKLRSAVRYLQAALREGIQVSARTLLRIVQACTNTLEYRAGLLVLRSLLRQWAGDSTSTIVYSSKGRAAVHQLFGLCAIDTSLYSTRPLPRQVSRVAVMNLKRHISVVSIEDKIRSHTKLLRSLEAVLAGSQTGLQRAQKALALLRDRNDSDRIRAVQKIANNEAAAAMRRSKSCDYKPWLKTQYLKLSGEWRRKYDVVLEQNPGLSWSDKFELIMFYLREKDIPLQHPLYTAVLSKKQLRKRGLSRWQGNEDGCSLGAKQSVAARKKITEEGKPKVRLQSRSKQPLQRSSSGALLHIPVPPLPDPTQTPTRALTLPFSPPNMGDRLHFTAP